MSGPHGCDPVVHSYCNQPALGRAAAVVAMVAAAVHVVVVDVLREHDDTTQGEGQRAKRLTQNE